MIVLSVVGILLAFGVLVFAAYKKISMFLAAVIAASLVALFSGLPVAASMVGAEGPFLIGMHEGLRGQLAGHLRHGCPAGRAV